MHIKMLYNNFTILPIFNAFIIIYKYKYKYFILLKIKIFIYIKFLLLQHKVSHSLLIICYTNKRHV